MADVLVLYDRSASRVVPMTVLPKHIEQMQASASGKVYWFEKEEDVLAKGIDADVLFIWGGNRKPPMAFIERSKKLKWIHTFSAGVDPIIESPIRGMDLIVTNGKGVHSYSMAVVAIGFIISLLRDFRIYHKRQSAHHWEKEFDNLPREIWGKTLVILGAGAIGAQLARLAKAFDMKVVGVKRSVTPLEHYDEVLPNSRMAEAAARADVVVCLVPLTPETRHLVDAEFFRAMKRTAYFINISRGAVVDEAALVDALRAGEIAGAALDAAEAEPLSADSPLWDMDNVVLTPHCSGDGESLMDRSVDQFCDLLRRYEAGEPLYNLIDLKKGS
ncbi:MAG: D-2-hydroxyacid dehydrogenase [Clostridiales Family XIII bacterium]|nr:D-2-hydroxyacid dehydrogenase [Clostridiales Family XIII bacterium]